MADVDGVEESVRNPAGGCDDVGVLFKVKTSWGSCWFIKTCSLEESSKSTIAALRTANSTGLATKRVNPAFAHRSVTLDMTFADRAIIGTGGCFRAFSHCLISAQAWNPSFRGMCKSHYSRPFSRAHSNQNKATHQNNSIVSRPIAKYFADTFFTI